jgi:hypothetical protein
LSIDPAEAVRQAEITDELHQSAAVDAGNGPCRRRVKPKPDVAHVGCKEVA